MSQYIFPDTGLVVVVGGLGAGKTAFILDQLAQRPEGVTGIAHLESGIRHHTQLHEYIEAHRGSFFTELHIVESTAGLTVSDIQAADLVVYTVKDGDTHAFGVIKGKFPSPLPRGEFTLDALRAHYERERVSLK